MKNGSSVKGGEASGEGPARYQLISRRSNLTVLFCVRERERERGIDGGRDR